MKQRIVQEEDFGAILCFEGMQESQPLRGWGGGPQETIHLDQDVVHSGDGAARLERDEESPQSFTSLTKQIPIDFGGEWIELRGFMRTEGVSVFAGLWMREDGRGGTLQFDNMFDQGVNGTTGWTEYTVRLPLDPKARELYFGVVMGSVGTVWADDLQLLVDGKPVAAAPERRVEPTVLETDREFDSGSGITAASLSERQIDHLVLAGKVWGYLKYHHPRVAAGELNWDYELFRVLPALMEATDREACNRVLAQWVAKIGVPERCDPCAPPPPEELHLAPMVDWIGDTELLGAELSSQLQQVYTYRFTGEEQFYVSTAPGVGNPVFHELGYSNMTPPDAGVRILALLRLWNIIQYWFPYRDLLDDDWEAELRLFLPRLAAAATWDEYRLELLALNARIQDGHARLWPAEDVCPPRGDCTLPVALRFIEGRPTVTAFTGKTRGQGSGLEVGDVIVAVDGQPVESLIEAWSPYYSASNPTVRLREIARLLPRGECVECTLTIERRGEPRTVVVPRVPGTEPGRITHDRPGQSFQMLSPEVAYLKLSSIQTEDIDRYIERASGTTGLVIDIRNYPAQFVVFALGSRLVQEPTPFARFTKCDLSNPGAFGWTDPVTLEPERPGYEGSVAILVDESSMSQPEYTAMAFRTGPRAVVVGSTTAGADGNVSSIPLPGGLRTSISGIGVFYPDKRPTQRVGIVPDIEARPTVDGLREGRDEVLEAAIRYILGPGADEETIRQMARRSVPAG